METAMKTMTDKKRGWGLLSLGLDAFAGLGLEVVYAFLLEPLLYGASMEGWNTWQTIVHWIITCISWGLVAAWVLRTGEKKYGLKLFEGSLKTVKLWQWALVAAGAALKIYASVMDWGGFKVYLEWKSHGTLLFIFQYIYYVFETLLFTLILVFAQLAFETWFKNRKIPYGGIVMGLTWGLAHIFTKGSLLIGLEGVAIGLLFGSLYLLLNRNLKGTMVLFFLLFVRICNIAETYITS